MAKSFLPTSFRQRVVIQSNTAVPDGQGGYTETWVDGVTVWAMVDTLRAAQRFQAMQMQAPGTHRIVMRYRNDVTSSVRIRFGTRNFSVSEVINHEERDRFLVITASERVTTGAAPLPNNELDFSLASNSGLAPGVM